MGEHWLFLTVCGFILAGVAGVGIWWAYGKVLLLTSKYRYQYSVLPTTNSQAGPSPNSRSRLTVPRLFRHASFKKDEESGTITETSYELFGRRDD